MFYTWNELSIWLSITPFEICLFLFTSIIYSILVTVKLENTFFLADKYLQSWWTVHYPLFIFDAISAYYCTIIFIRQYQSGKHRAAFIRAFFTFKRIFLLFTLNILLCYKLDHQVNINFSEVFLPLFYLLIILICQSFRL